MPRNPPPGGSRTRCAPKATCWGTTRARRRHGLADRPTTGPGPWPPCSPRPRSAMCWSTARRGLGRPWRGLERAAVNLGPRRTCATSPNGWQPGGTAPRRRGPLGGRPAARRDPAARRAPADRPARSAAVLAGAARHRVHPRRPGRPPARCPPTLPRCCAPWWLGAARSS